MNGFALLIGLGASLGLWQIARNGSPTQIQRWIEDGLIILLGCLIGARIAYILIRTAYYTSHPIEALMFWQGGFSWIGAAAGAFLMLPLMAWVQQIPVAQYADTMAPLFAPLAVGIWLGCWQAGCGCGPAITNGLNWGLISRDETGKLVSRFPTQILAAVSLLVFFWQLESRQNLAQFPGFKASLTGLGISASILFFSFFISDPSKQIANIRLDTWAAALFLIFSFAAAIYSRRHKYPE